jgi:hypothetical protein
MTPTDPKLLLARAETPAERKRAVTIAMATGMALHEIEEFLDWADAVRAGSVTEPLPEEHTLFFNLIKMYQQESRPDRLSHSQRATE